MRSVVNIEASYEDEYGRGFETITITPDIAAMMLESNTKNSRRPDAARVALYAKEMATGNWKTNGDTIKFNGSVLLDGQHRLLAVVKSGVTIQSLVVRGVPDDGKTIDRGRPRTIAQWCSHVGIKSANDVAATARLCVYYTKGSWGKTNFQSSPVADSEVFTFIEKHRESLSLAVRAASRCRRLIPVSLLGTVLFVGCGGADPDSINEAKWFCQSLQKGEGITSSDAVFHLRKRLLDQSPTRKLDIFMRRCLLTIAWNKTVKGEHCSGAAMSLKMTGPSRQSPPSQILCIQANKDQDIAD